MNQKQLVRHNFRESVFKRDGHKCRVCGKTGDLDAHHITDRSLMPKGGYVRENGISLCPECHLKAEKFHISEGKEWEENFHPTDLYRLIGTYKELAIMKSNLTL
jgi:5-methylcytosine-specific restriction endonuclease McrA